MEMRSQLDVNYKTALLLCRKCRVIMAECNENVNINFTNLDRLIFTNLDQLSKSSKTSLTL